MCIRDRVKEDAQKTAAYQTNRNLCATREARMYSKPQLEIYADDVKCSHGMTTGQLDETALFYICLLYTSLFRLNTPKFESKIKVTGKRCV